MSLQACRVIYVGADTIAREIDFSLERSERRLLDGVVSFFIQLFVLGFYHPRTQVILFVTKKYAKSFGVR
ncbi:MAG: hypothetical protein PHS44_07250 [Candidatus Dojkabacteria bacterium]|nr:hypothetical protein [Candidatus Dojkabacteria bacterium]